MLCAWLPCATISIGCRVHQYVSLYPALYFISISSRETLMKFVVLGGQNRKPREFRRHDCSGFRIFGAMVFISNSVLESQSHAAVAFSSPNTCRLWKSKLRSWLQNWRWLHWRKIVSKRVSHFFGGMRNFAEGRIVWVKGNIVQSMDFGGLMGKACTLEP